MKKNITIFLGALCLLFACQNEEGESASFNEELLIRDPLQKQSAENYADSVRNWYFHSASPQNRYDFWYSKIQVDMNYLDLNSTQREFVLEIFSQLSAQDFEEGQSPSPEFTAWLKDWLSRSTQFQLSKGQMGQFIYSLSPAPSGPSVGRGFVDRCNCSTESDWCDFLNNGPSSECNGTCDMESSRGCGALLLYDCDKDCSF